MTFAQLNKLIETYRIPSSVTLMSDSGWECDATHMNGVYYNEEDNVIVFTQSIHKCDSYFEDKKWKALAWQ